MNKALICTMLTGFLSGSLDSASAATNDGPEIKLNGQLIDFTDVGPVQMHDRIFVPYRKIFESLGATVTWDEATHTAVAFKEGLKVKVPLGGNIMTVNDHPLAMDVSSTVVNDHMMVPIRFVSQSLGATVKWTAGNAFTRDQIELNLNRNVTVPKTILGESQAPVEQMVHFVKSNNPDFNPDIAKAYLEVGKTYGIRGDVAFCQAILETGWFTFGGGTAVTLDQNNFCGLGVTRKGAKGNSFPTIRDGVTAHIQHLYAYATTAQVPTGEKVVDPRFKYVSRGIANVWGELNNRWAMNDHYGQSILSVYERLKSPKHPLR